MIEAKPYLQEEKRLAALKSLHLLDMPIEERFERITRMVCRILDVPIAIFNLVDADRQYYKSVQGLNAHGASLDGAFCTHALHEQNMLLVPDTIKDNRFHDNPFVTGKLLNIRFYAGCPIRVEGGLPIGTLCAIDTKPRNLTRDQLYALGDLAAMLQGELQIANLAKTHSEIKDLSNKSRIKLIDPKTRLWNTEGIYKVLRREWLSPDNKDKTFHIIIASIDHFKSITEKFGTAGAENVTKSVAKRLLSALKGEDSIGALNERDFLIALKTPENEHADIDNMITHLDKEISMNPLITGRSRHLITMSFGRSCAKAGQGRLEDLITKAEDELYQKKKIKRRSSQFST